MEKLESRPLVSVCIPVYNCQPFIAQAIESVLKQTCQDFELVIIDNASTDGSYAEAEKFATTEPRIRLLRNATNIGAEGNWNRCLEEARGKYIKLLPADDLLYPTNLERQVRILEDPAMREVALVCAQRDLLNEAGETIYRGRGLARSGRISSEEAIRLIVRSGGNPLGEPHAVLFRAENARQVGKFDASIGYLIDLDYWCRLLRTGSLYCIAEPLSAFRVNPRSWSTSVAKSQATETRRFWRRLQERGWASPGDVRVGALWASVMGFIRQSVYTGLALRERLRGNS